MEGSRRAGTVGSSGEDPLYLQEVVVDARQAVGGADAALLVPLIHQRALVLHPEPPAVVLACLQHGLADLRKETTTTAVEEEGINGELMKHHWEKGKT